MEGKILPLSYNKLWKILIDKGMNKVTLRDSIGITSATLAKLSKNERVRWKLLKEFVKN